MFVIVEKFAIQPKSTSECTPFEKKNKRKEIGDFEISVGAMTDFIKTSFGLHMIDYMKWVNTYSCTSSGRVNKGFVLGEVKIVGTSCSLQKK